MSLQEKRKVIVSRIMASYKEVSEKGLEIDEDLLRLEISGEYGCSMRTANEYLKVAKTMLKKRTYDIEDTNTPTPQGHTEDNAL